jgi:hypothetical protein
VRGRDDDSPTDVHPGILMLLLLIHDRLRSGS